MIVFLAKYRILILCILGSLVRLVYGCLFQPWTQAPDQLAWEFVLEQSSFSYDHLIHYPHEGGTILISLLSQFIETFTSFSSLSVIAFIIDFIVRFFQIKIVNKVFNLQIATFFGLWTIFASPSIIPYGTVNFGLHSIASVFPFIAFYLLSLQKTSIKFQLIGGLFLGLAFWFSYSNLVLIPAFYLYYMLTRQKLTSWIYSIVSLSTVLILHLLVRVYADPGFHLSEFGLTAVRSADFSIFEVNVLARLYHFPAVIANAATALPGSDWMMLGFRILFFLLVLCSMIGFRMAHKRQEFKVVFYGIVPMLFLFLLTYLFSPFFDSKDFGDHITYRHLTYILPLLSLFMILGLASLKNKALLAVFLLAGMIRGFQLFFTEKADRNDTVVQASGWILGTKMGHDPEVISAIIAANPTKKEILIRGVGWGISNSLMDNNQGEEESKINQLVALYYSYPIDYREGLLEGIKFSFSDEVTPRLNKDLQFKIEDKIRDPMEREDDE